MELLGATVINHSSWGFFLNLRPFGGLQLPFPHEGELHALMQSFVSTVLLVHFRRLLYEAEQLRDGTVLMESKESVFCWKQMVGNTILMAVFMLYLYSENTQIGAITATMAIISNKLFSPQKDVLHAYNKWACEDLPYSQFVTFMRHLLFHFVR